MQTVWTKNNGNRVIEQYEWTIGMCITVQIGERGTFMDVQIGERGKERVQVPFWYALAIHLYWTFGLDKHSLHVSKNNFKYCQFYSSKQTIHNSQL